jgi:hypothetical protein
MFKLIFWILVGVLALSFFGISLQSIVNSPAGQENFAYLWHVLVSLWNWLTSFIPHK